MRRSPPVVVGLIGIAVASFFAARVLAENPDPTIFIAFGEESTEITQFAEERLGRDVLTRPALGHDGKYFFVQANDPWMRAPDENIGVIDRPLYRGQRMLYPVIAGGLGAFSPGVIVWALIVVNVVSMGVGSWAVAKLATDMGGAAWWGLTFTLNIGFISETLIDGAGVLAAAAAFWAVVMIRRGHTAWMAVLLAGSALAREAMLIAAAGLAVWLWRRGSKKGAVVALGTPIAAVAAWAVYLRIRMGWDSGITQVQEIGWPFGGIIGAIPNWLSDPVDLAAGIVTILILLLFARRMLASREPVGWAFLGFVPLAFLFTQQVWQSYFDITRAVAPVLTAFVLLMFLETPKTRGDLSAGAPEASGLAS